MPMHVVKGGSSSSGAPLGIVVEGARALEGAVEGVQGLRSPHALSSAPAQCTFMFVAGPPMRRPAAQSRCIISCSNLHAVTQLCFDELCCSHIIQGGCRGAAVIR